MAITASDFISEVEQLPPPLGHCDFPWEAHKGIVKCLYERGFSMKKQKEECTHVVLVVHASKMKWTALFTPFWVFIFLPIQDSDRYPTLASRLILY